MRALCADSIHLFYTRTDDISSEKFYAQCRQVLSREEMASAQRFRDPRDRHLSMVSRAMVRYLVSEYTGILAKAIQFKTTRHGKPCLVTSPDSFGGDIRFNLSHCKGGVLCGLCLARDIGVDLETMARRVNPAVASRFFSSKEAERIMNVSKADERKNVFLDTWTLKEAYIKATGKGLATPLDAFSFDRLTPKVEISFKGGTDCPGNWQFFRWKPEPGKIAAAAVRSKNPMEMKSFYCTPFQAIVDAPG